MATNRGDAAQPGFGEVLRQPHYLPVFVATALSLWGDYVARITLAAVVFERTRSPLATATTLAVSLVPSVFGRSLFGPLVDRFPYKWVLLSSQVLRALLVGLLLVLVVTVAPLWTLLGTLLVLEMIGGASAAASLLLQLDLLPDPRLYGKGVGLSALSEQVNQAVGLAVGGGLVALVGAEAGLVFDAVTFVVAAVVVLTVVPLRPVAREATRGLGNYLRDIGSAARDLTRHPLLARFVALSAVASLGIAAPEALAIPLAGTSPWGGVLMAAPIAGAAVGILLMTARPVAWQNRSILPAALVMPLPLLVLALRPPLVVVGVAFVVSGVLQAFMVPLQATFALAIEPALRGRMFSLAGSVAVASAGLSYLLAGWIGTRTNPYTGVSVSAAICLVAIVLLAVSWPHRQLQAAVDTAYAGADDAGTSARPAA